MAQADNQLLLKAVNGDTSSLTELLRCHGPAVQRTLQIGKIWQNVLEPADIMQVTYLEAFLQISSFDPSRTDAFEAWLRRIAQNNLRDAIRGLERKKQPQPKARVTPASHEDSLIGLCDLLGATSTTPSRHAGRNELCKLLETSISALPDRYAQVIRLYDLEARPIDEVAEALGKSAGAIHMMRARAHDRLRDFLGGTSSVFFHSKP